MPKLVLFLTALFACIAARATAAESPNDESQAADDRLVLEIVKRTKDVNLDTASVRVKAAIGRHLAKIRGSKEYFEFVERFGVRAERDNLLELGVSQAGTVNAASAFKALIRLGEIDAVRKRVLSSDPGKMSGLFDTLSLSQSREAAQLVMQCAADAAATPEARQAAVKALGKSRNGENVLLDAAKAGTLPAELKLAAGSILNASQDAGIRSQAAKILPMPASADNKPLPPIGQLAQRKGDSAKGTATFLKLCASCHKLGDQGLDFGPSLAEIGTKLAREALYQSILDPNAGVSFGFEGFEIKTKSGDTLVGMIAGETDSELSIKAPGGVVVKTPKADITARTKLPNSLMTPNLQAMLTEQELVDLVEYLTTLKKK